MPYTDTPILNNSMSLNYSTPLDYNPVDNKHVLWIHNLTGCDFLVRDSYEELVKLAEAMCGVPGSSQEGYFTCDNRELQTQIRDDGFEPVKFFYTTIAYVEPFDAYRMIMTNTDPETYFTELRKTFAKDNVPYPLKFSWPDGFKMLEREAPYDFTREIMNPEEFDHHPESVSNLEVQNEEEKERSTSCCIV